MSGLFDVEPLIIQRITARDTGGLFRTIDSASLVAGVANIAEYAPACFALPGNGEYDERKSRLTFREDQQWQLSVIVSHLIDPDGLETTASKAGELCKLVIEALHDWRPSSSFPLTMKYVGRDTPDYQTGWAEFPLVFEIKVSLDLAEDSCR